MQGLRSGRSCLKNALWMGEPTVQKAFWVIILIKIAWLTKPPWFQQVWLSPKAKWSFPIFLSFLVRKDGFGASLISHLLCCHTILCLCRQLLAAHSKWNHSISTDDNNFWKQKYAILGHKIAYSVSPQMLGAVFAATQLGSPWLYSCRYAHSQRIWWVSLFMSAEFVHPFGDGPTIK